MIRNDLWYYKYSNWRIINVWETESDINKWNYVRNPAQDWFVSVSDINSSVNITFNNYNNKMFYHYDKDWNRKLVASLGESHLTNIVKNYCENITKLKSQLGKPLTFDERIAWVEKMDDDDIIEKVRKMSESLSAYLIECYIRDLPVWEYIQKAFGRKEAITLRDDLPALTNLNEYTDEDVDEGVCCED